nr:hypothetical protein [Tanacetum cinerariifolium]
MDNLGTKSGGWDQFGSPIAVALICLSDRRRFNWSSYIFKGMGKNTTSSSYIFKGMVSNIGNAKKFLMYPRFLQTILGAPYATFSCYAVQQHMPAPDQPQDHLSTPPRQQTSDPNALVFEHGQISDPNIASFSRTHETNDDPFTNVEDEPLGGSFYMSPPRSTQAPPAGQTSSDAEDLITLTALSSVVSTLVQKVNSLETELKDHKKLFKIVVGKLVKKVKAMEVKLRTTKRKMVVSDSDKKEGGKQDVDLDALLALANAAVTVDSNISPGGASNNPAASTSVPADVPTSANVPTSSTSVPADVPTSVAPAGVSNKGKTPMVEEDITINERTFKQTKDDRLGEQAAKRLHDDEQAQGDRQKAELQRRRQQEVFALAMYYTEADWITIMAQVAANASLSKTLLGDDVSEDTFPARMATLIKRKKQAFTEKLAKERKDKPMTQGQQRTYMRQFDFEEDMSLVSSPKSSGTRRKSLGRNRLTKPKSKLKELDLDADDQIFIKVVSNKDSEDEAPLLWSALVGWEVITTPLGDINALYKIDLSTAHFTILREILHMVDRQDLVTLYGLVVKYYENNPVAGAGLILWGDLQVLFDSYEGDKGSFVWHHQHLWQISSWRLYTLSNVHVLETVSGEVVYMFADVSYPFSVKLIERMLKHYVVSTSRVVVPTGRYVVPAGNVIIVSTGRLSLIPTGRVIVPTGRYVVPTSRVVVPTGRAPSTNSCITYPEYISHFSIQALMKMNIKKALEWFLKGVVLGSALANVVAGLCIRRLGLTPPLGRLEDAFDFKNKMEFEPNEFICIKPKDLEVYTMLMNMYVSTKRWKEVSRLRKAMKEENFTKLKDWSWISIKDKVYSFKPHDKSCYQCQDVHVLLEDLLEKSRNLGYEWKENLEILEDEENKDKEPSFSRVHHSEKFVVVYDLLKIPKPTVVCVVKCKHVQGLS